MIKLEVEIYDCQELSIIYDALDKITHARDQRSGRQPVCKVTRQHVDTETPPVLASLNRGEDVPLVPIDVAIEEAYYDETAPAPAPTVVPSEADAVAAYRRAVSSGVTMPEIVKVLVANNVKRVSELAPEQRAGFIAEVEALTRVGYHD